MARLTTIAYRNKGGVMGRRINVSAMEVRRRSRFCANFLHSVLLLTPYRKKVFTFGSVGMYSALGVVGAVSQTQFILGLRGVRNIYI